MSTRLSEFINIKMSNIIRGKLVVLGSSGVGKSTLVQSFITKSQEFSKNFNLSTEVNLRTKTVNIPDTSDMVELYIYDMPGSDIYKEIVNALLVELDMIAVVFDISDKETFHACHNLFEKISALNLTDPVSGILIGNKIDLTKRIKVASEDAQELASKYGFKYCECSVKNNSKVDEPFYFLVNEYYKLHQEKLGIFD